MARYKHIALLLLSAAFSLSPLIASASTGLSIQPIKIDQELKPGDSITGTILLTNASDGPVDVDISLQDFLPNPGYDSIAFVPRAPGVTSVRDWITVGIKSPLSLKIGEEKDIPFTITAPMNAEPGSHMGVVLFKATPQGAAVGSLKVGTQVGALVLIAIPGQHLEKGKILDFSVPLFLQHGPVPFGIKFENTGTVHFEPKGSIVITDMLGLKAGEVPITGEIVLPSSVRNLSFAWVPGSLAIGRYTAVATIYDGDGNALTSDTVSFWMLPIWYIVAFVISVALIYFLLRYLKRHVSITLR